MTWLEQNKKPLVQALIVFGLLFGVVLLIAFFYDFSDVDLGALLFISAFLSCVIISKNTFDTIRMSEVSDKLKKSEAFGLAVSSEEVYVQLYEKSPVPYLIIDGEGNIRSANVASVRMLGIKQKKFKGINIFDRIECEEESRIDVLVSKYRNGVSVSAEIIKIKRADKKQYWALMSLFKLDNIAGEQVGLMAMVDITKQKKAEDAKSEFVSLASHQLRTPIAGMKWSTELLLMDNPENLNERQRKYIDRLLVSVRRMAVLVDDFLRVSRFELGTFKPEIGKVDLVEVFDDIILELAQRVDQKKLEIKKFYDESIGTVMTDRNLIRMIVTNLYSNATKYTREKGTIHIGFARKQDNLAITVADNGMGIPPEDQDEIFSKLFRASNAVRDVPDGTGLGLYIAKEAVSVLQGNITFTTTENIGTTFEVVLPLDTIEE